MPLHVSPAVSSDDQIQSGDTITVTVNAHVDKDVARAGARFTIPDNLPVFFELPNGRFKRVFIPEFQLDRMPQPVTGTLVIVADESAVSVPIDVEVADLSEVPPETRTKAVTIDIQV